MTTTAPNWRKSTYSDINANCVELATTATRVLVRDSKHPTAGHVSFAPAELAALIDACETGQLDNLA